MHGVNLEVGNLAMTTKRLVMMLLKQLQAVRRTGTTPVLSGISTSSGLLN
jgi:hypothetical protein